MARDLNKALSIVQGMSPEQKKQAQALFRRSQQPTAAPKRTIHSQPQSKFFATATKGNDLSKPEPKSYKRRLSGPTSYGQEGYKRDGQVVGGTQGTGSSASFLSIAGGGKIGEAARIMAPGVGTGTQESVASGAPFDGQPSQEFGIDIARGPMEERAEPTVATADQPFVDRDAGPSMYEAADFGELKGYDQEQLQDFTDYMMVKQQRGEQLTQDEMVQLTKANRLLESQAQEMPELAQMQLEEEEARFKETEAKLGTETANLVEQKRQQLEQQFQQRAEDMRAAGKEEQQAGQTAMSFSGFGRSTKAAEMATKIEKRVQSNIASLATARDLEMQMFEAEQKGANAQQLQGMRQQIDGLRQQAFEEKAAAITEANRINQETSMSYQDKISNLLEVASQGDMQEPTEQEMGMIPQWAAAIMDGKGNIDDKVLAQLPEHLIPLIIAEASNINSPADAPKIQKIGKNTYGYFQNGELVRVGGGGGGSGVGRGPGGGISMPGGIGSGGYTGDNAEVGIADGQAVSFDPDLAAAYQTIMKDPGSKSSERIITDLGISMRDLQSQGKAWKHSMLSAHVGNALDSVDFLDSNEMGRRQRQVAIGLGGIGTAGQADFQAQYNFIKENLTMDRLISLKEAGASFGALSDAERVAVGNAANAIQPGMSDTAYKKQLDIIRNTLKTSVGGNDPRGDQAPEQEAPVAATPEQDAELDALLDEAGFGS